MALPRFCHAGFLLEETDCGSSRGALDTNTDLFEANNRMFSPAFQIRRQKHCSATAPPRSMSVLSNSPDTTKRDTRRALLSERLRKAAESAIPLSFAQQRLWFLDQVEPNSPLYNVPTVVKMRGTLNIEALQFALNQIVTRHESLRT